MATLKTIGLVLFLSISLVQAIEWQSPTYIVNLTSSWEFLTTFYYDTPAKISHIVVEAGDFKYMHYAISDDGKILYQTHFGGTSWNYWAIIAGPKDGKHIYIAYYTVGEHYQDSFIESEDGGKTWTPEKVVMELDKDLRLDDFLYIKETGRLFVFSLSDPTWLVWYVTRPAGSTQFSNPVSLTSNSFCSSIKVTYTNQDGKIRLHMFARGWKGELLYLSSDDNGIMWSTPKSIGDDRLDHIDHAIGISNSKTSKLISTYARVEDKTMLRMIISEDYGQTFNKPITISNDYYVFSSISVFGTPQNPMMTSLSCTSAMTADFYFVDLKTYEKKRWVHPFPVPGIYTVGMDTFIIADPSKSELHVFAAASQQLGNPTQWTVLFSHGVEYITEANEMNQ